MSALYGRLTADDGRTKATRCAHRDLVTTAETWSGVLRVELDKSGQFSVSVSGKHGEDSRVIAQGNLDTRYLVVSTEQNERVSRSVRAELGAGWGDSAAVM